MQHTDPRRRGPVPAVLVALLALVAAACGGGGGGTTGTGEDASGPAADEPLVISAIPDQDPERLQRLYGSVADHLSGALGVPVRYEPVTDYTASVSLFATGELDLVWFGGLTGVQARLQTDGAQAIVQRDIDAEFHSVFIANASSGVVPVADVAGLVALKGKRFTFGSESSTSGRLMPQYYLDQAGVTPGDFAGPPGFSGSHDRTIALVESGSFEAGVVNEQVWKAAVDGGKVDPAEVKEVFRTPPYHDYHWVLGTDAATRYGDDFTDRVTQAFLDLDPADPEHREILDLFGATAFVETSDANYAEIEEVGRRLGLIAEGTG